MEKIIANNQPLQLSSVCRIYPIKCQEKAPKVK